jgi:hypothetical protein
MFFDFLLEVRQQTLQGCDGSGCKSTVSAPEMPAHFFEQRNKIFPAFTVFQAQKQISNKGQAFPAGGTPAAGLSGKKLR